MRLRNVKNKDILLTSDKLIRNPKDYRGRWCELFKNNNSLHLEIGMGKGDFIIEMALRNPNINFIGIEKYDNVMVRALEKVPDVNNLFLIRIDAMEIDEVFDKEIDVIYLNFSDPWPKNRHHKRRLTSHVFLSKYAKICQKNSHLIMKTDNQDLFTYSIVSLSNFDYKIKKLSLDLHKDKDDIVETEYERKFVKLGYPIYYLEASFIKNDD